MNGKFLPLSVPSPFVLRLSKDERRVFQQNLKIQLGKVREDANVMGRAIDFIMINLFEPSLHWALSHPFVSVVVVGALIFFACRNYKML